jgi:1,2-diacylglycerol 3-alpha-glucosyltransferase
VIAAIVCAKFSPFHTSRIETAAVLGREHGHELVGIEVARHQAEYGWAAGGADSKYYSRVTLFPDRDYESLSYGDVRRRLGETLAAVRPDVVVLPGWGLKEALTGLGWCVRHRVARVLMSASQRADNPQRWWKLLVKRKLVGLFQTGFVGGAAQRRYLTELGMAEDACSIGCDVVDNKFFMLEAARRRSHDVERSNRLCLLSCIRLVKKKNVPFVLEVLATDAKEWEWVIAGHGPEYDEIVRKIRFFSLGDRVRLLGHVEYQRLPHVYAEADVYIQPSVAEPWGLAINEAMASGLPVLVSDRCGCHEDLVEEGKNGLRFNPVDRMSLVRALNQLVAWRDDWRRMGEASRQIIGKWSLDLFAESFWGACEKALKHGTGGMVPRPLSSIIGSAL